MSCLVDDNTAGKSLPSRVASGMPIGQHGSWNRSTPSGYKVNFILFANGMPCGDPEDVLTGFLDANGRARGRQWASRSEETVNCGPVCGLKEKCARKFLDIKWSWRRRRDSNPRYAFKAYDDLANRCLQPLGHVSPNQWVATL